MNGKSKSDLTNRLGLAGAALGLLLLLPSWVLAQGTQAPAPATVESGQVIVEAGLAMPYGDLDDDFEASRLGAGADNGFVLGFRYRHHLTPTVSVSPGFHFVDFANFEGVHPDLDEFSIQASSLRYTVELMVISPLKSRGRPRPFLATALGLYRNRLQGYYNDFDEELDESLNTLGLSFRGGVQIQGFELSLIYHVNRFNTWSFRDSDYRERYNWDNVSIRAGWIVPLN